MRVAFVTGDLAPWEGKLLPGGCAYYRQLLPRNVVPGSAFGRPAWSASTGFGVMASDTTAQFGFDVVVFKMLMARWLPEQIRQAQALGQKIIVDVDDAYDFLHPANRAYTTTDPAKNAIHNRQYHHEVVMAADLVTVSTPFLHEHYRDMRDDVVLVRNGINPKQFVPRKHTSVAKPIIGWVGATGWRSNDVEVVADWLPAWLEEHDCLFLHAGAMDDQPQFDELAGIRPERMLKTHMLPLTMYHDLFRMDIGIVPLSDIPFNHAKSTIKGLEYAASNIPFVASALPEYERLADLGVGRVAATPQQWEQHLTELLDYRTRKVEAARQRIDVLQNHSIQARAHEWAGVFGRFADVRLPLQTMTVPYAA